MNALRKKIKRTGNKIIIELPEDFIADEIEMIILPVVKSSEDNFKSDKKLWEKFSIDNLERAYSETEPDYTNVLVKENNPKYGK